MLALAMAFLAKPKLLMIDELSLGLAPLVVEQLLEVVKKFREQGITVILVEQSVNVALTTADKAFFMEKGAIRFHGLTAELLERPDLLRSIFLEGAAAATGEEDEEARPPSATGSRPRPPPSTRSRPRTTTTNGRCGRDRESVPMAERAVVLETQDVTKRFAGITAVDGVSIQLHEGEILGIIGPNGAGKTTLFDLISGFLIPDAGRGAPRGPGHHPAAGRRSAPCSGSPARSRTPASSARSPCTRRSASRSTGRCRSGTRSRRCSRSRPSPASASSRSAPTSSSRSWASATTATSSCPTSPPAAGASSTSPARSASQPKVILFDEPSSGIAQRETEALGPLIVRIREITGASILVIEHDMPLITSISDRIVACDLGQVVVDGDAETVLNHPQVVASYLGSTREVIERSDTTAPVLTPVRRCRRMTVTESRRPRPTRPRTTTPPHPRRRTRTSDWIHRVLERYRNSFSVARASLFWACLSRQKRTLKWMFAMLILSSARACCRSPT